MKLARTLARLAAAYVLRAELAHWRGRALRAEAELEAVREAESARVVVTGWVAAVGRGWN